MVTINTILGNQNHFKLPCHTVPPWGRRDAVPPWGCKRSKKEETCRHNRNYKPSATCWSVLHCHSRPRLVGGTLAAAGHAPTTRCRLHPGRTQPHPINDRAQPGYGQQYYYYAQLAAPWLRPATPCQRSTASWPRPATPQLCPATPWS
jgi:hypothetical protein